MRLLITPLPLVTSLLAGTVASDARAEDLYVPSQITTIQAAVAQARVDRLYTNLSKNETIVIHVAAGQYVETLPIVLDVPNMRLEGATVLTTDSKGIPTGSVNAAESRIVAKPVLAGYNTNSLLIIGPTSTDLTGNGVTVQGLVLDAGNAGNAVGGLDILVDRVANFSIRRNIVTGAAGLGVDARAASGVIEENFFVGNGAGGSMAAGNKSSPASYWFRKNRVVNNKSEGVGVAGSNLGGSNPVLLPVAPGTIFDSVTAVISGNDVRDNNQIPNFTSGIRLLVIVPTIPVPQAAGNLSVSVTDNTIANNALGVSIDAGFPDRTDPRLWTGNLRASFDGNSISGSKLTPALITFTRNEAATQPSKPKYWKYLQDSTFTISDPNGDLNGYWFDHPAVDPIDGRFLNNVLVVNGLTIPNGRNFK